MEYLIVIVAVAAVLIALSTVSDRLGVAPQLILMLVGVGISFLPWVNFPVIEPEWILAGILPPLLYAAAIAIPAVDLRRDFSAVGGLAIILVVISAVALGFVFHWLIPGVSLPIGIAMGAILSPTDAAATQIVKRLGVPNRVRIILEGESLFNDATSLVLLRSAIAAAIASVSLWEIALDFIWAALAAALIGIVIGWLGVQLRHLVHKSAPATVISLVLPFAAWVAAESVHASGLVAVVAAGIVAAQLGPKRLDARQRLAERENWHTLEFLLESVVFFGMGLELYSLATEVHRDHDSIWFAVGLAALGILIVLVLRAAFFAVLLPRTHANTKRKAARSAQMRDRDPDEVFHARLDTLSDERRAQLRARLDRVRPRTRASLENRLASFRARWRRYAADADYLMHQPLGVKEGTLLTWAGMRGVVTLAAAQTLPFAIAHRSLMVVIAFFVAAGALVVQGGTLSWVVRILGLSGQDSAPEGEWDRLQHVLSAVADEIESASEAPDSAETSEARLAEDALALTKVHAQREALLELRSIGSYSSRSLALALADLDAQEAAIQIRLARGD